MRVLISKYFLKGYLKAINLSGTKEWPNISKDKIADYNALRSDWENVGKSIRNSTRDYQESRR